VIRTPPATRVTVAGRACAKRMRTPYQCCSLLLRNDLFSMEWHGGRCCVRLARYATHSTPGAPFGATRRTYPGIGRTGAGTAIPGMMYAYRDVADTQRVTSGPPDGDSRSGCLRRVQRGQCFTWRRCDVPSARGGGASREPCGGARLALPGLVTLRDVGHGLFWREPGMFRRHLMLTSDSSAPRHVMVAPPQQVALTRVNVPRPCRRYGASHRPAALRVKT